MINTHKYVCVFVQICAFEDGHVHRYLCFSFFFFFSQSDQLITWWCLYCAGKVSRAQLAVGQSSCNLREKSKPSV